MFTRKPAGAGKALLILMVLAMTLAIAAGAAAKSPNAPPTPPGGGGDTDPTFTDLYSWIVKNVSNTPDLYSTKSRVEVVPRYFPAMTASGVETHLKYYADDGVTILYERDEAKPIVQVYLDEIADTGGARDVFAAYSRDDGNTWQRSNLSRHGGLSSFRLKDGTDYPAIAVKPSLHVKGNKILIVWTSTYARGGSPRYAITDTEDPNYTLDVWGVGGSQKSTDYTKLGFPEVGELPYTVVWACRGVIDIDASDDTEDSDTTLGDVTWFQPERLTSGTRNAMQLVEASAGTGTTLPGFVIAWEEDPLGIRTGSGEGPGLGWSGAIVNHGTEIWYSYLKYADHDLIDEETELVDGRPKAAVLMSLPVRITDNEMVNTDNVDSHPYVWGPDGDPTTDTDNFVKPISEWHSTTNTLGDPVTVAVTKDDRLLDGDTGSSRPALFLQPYTKADGTLSAWAVLAYEESKGLGGGAPEAPNPDPGEEDVKPDEGRLIMYHTFDFTSFDIGTATATNPADLVSGGYNMNPEAIDPATYSTYSVTDENGGVILDWEGNEIPAYENARRPRLLIQGKSAAVAGKPTTQKATVMVLIFKQGETSQGGPSDIFIRRWEVCADDKGNPYDPKYLVKLNLIDEDTEDVYYAPAGLTNVSAVSGLTWDETNVDQDPKMETWEQTVDNLADLSWEEPGDNGQGHRGWLRGDQLVLGYTWTPDWLTAANGNAVYNLYVRRSFDGGKTFTTTPAALGGLGVDWEDFMADADRTPVTLTLAAGDFEPARNVTRRIDTKVNIIEPRTVPAPNTIWAVDPIPATGTTPAVPGVPTGYPEDISNRAVIWLFWGTGAVYASTGSEEEDLGKVPLDLGFLFSDDYGDTWQYQVKTEVSGKGKNTIVTELLVPYTLASGPTLQGEAQPKFSPSGEICYVGWNDDGPADVGAMDVYFARIAPDFLSSYIADEE